MYLVDTNIVIWLLRGEKPYIKWFERVKQDTTLFVSAVTVAEVYKNVFPSELSNTEQLFNDFETLNVTFAIGKLGGLYWNEYNKRLKTLHIIDCIIAATASEQDLTLLTLNTRHFPMDDIKVLDPLKIS